MTELRFESMKLPGVPPGKASEFPILHDTVKISARAELGEDDGLFINYGRLSDSLPFTAQDDYDAEPKQELTFRTAVLENEHLKAVFNLDLGARLWSLFDKDERRDLILNNPEFRPANLALRNEWFAGGIEWNISRGHDAQTCSPRFAAELNDEDGTPVLRIYEFNRDRGLPFQMDFYLPSGSRFLLARMRIKNPAPEVVPVYWWSNIAVEETPGTRIVVPAFEAYANRYKNGNHFLSKIRIPDGEGFDATYPAAFPYAKDHFYNIPDRMRKYECVFREDGRGFTFCSTRRLAGRKLFVWGRSSGGQHWQRKLGDVNYLEIQGGLAKTQAECLPMPPDTAWEWMEAYGPVALPRKQISGEWKQAVDAVSAELERLLPDSFLDAELERTARTFAHRKGTVAVIGSGWGALEEKRRGSRLEEHLDFGAIQSEQVEWAFLLNSGGMDDAPPHSFQADEKWKKLLGAVPIRNWKVLYHRALCEFRDQNFTQASELLSDSLFHERNPWNVHASAHVQYKLENRSEAAELFSEFIRLRRGDASAVKDGFRMLFLLGEYKRIILLFETLADEVRKRPMIRFLLASALAYSGEEDRAEAILMENGGLEIPDLREGETSISELYQEIRVRQAARKGKTIAKEEIKIPFVFDIRMS